MFVCLLNSIGIPAIFNGPVENTLADNYKKSAGKGRAAMTEVCDDIVLTPVTFVSNLARKVTKTLKHTFLDYSDDANDD
eukprot:Awhi_evm1s3604